MVSRFLTETRRMKDLKIGMKYNVINNPRRLREESSITSGFYGSFTSFPGGKFYSTEEMGTQFWSK